MASMRHNRQPLSLPPIPGVDLLSNLLDLADSAGAPNRQPAIALVVCQPRTEFLSSLAGATADSQASLTPKTDPSATAEDVSQRACAPDARHPLLHPTIGRLAASNRINIHFTPSITHARGFLAAWTPDDDSSGDVGQVRLLVVHGLVELHRSTSDWSAQGIGSTLAAAVDAAWRLRRRLIVVEALGEARGNDVEALPRTGPPRQQPSGASLLDASDAGAAEEDEGVNEAEEDLEDVKPIPFPHVQKLSNEHRAKAVEREKQWWEEQVPMLNGSVHRHAVELAPWGGRTVELGQVLMRWCRMGSRESWSKLHAQG